MRLEKEFRARCEISGCGKSADFTINLNRSGIRSKIHVCKGCLHKLYSLIGDTLVPKSIETIKKTNYAKQA